MIKNNYTSHYAQMISNRINHGSDIGVLIRLSDKYHVCLHCNSCAYGMPTPSKTWLVLSNVFMNAGCLNLCDMY